MDFGKDQKKWVETVQQVQARKEEFGRLVKELRTKQKLSRQVLFKKSLVPAPTIVKLENAKKAVLDRDMVARLCNALELEGFPRREFFVIAGLNPDPDPELPDWVDIISGFYRETLFPAFVLDVMFNLHSVNGYFMDFFGVAASFFKENVFKPAGRNLLYYLFHPRIRSLYGTGWKDYAIVNVYLFRQMVHDKIHTNDYHTLTKALHELQDFKDIWKITDELTQIPGHPPYIITLQSPELGQVKYLHSEAILPLSYTEQKHLAMYIPADAMSEQSFAKLRSRANVAYQIDLHFTGGLTRFL